MPSPLTKVVGKIVQAAVPAIVEALVSAFRPKRPLDPPPPPRQHAWGHGLDPVTCAYCKRTYSAELANAICPATIMR